MEKDQLLNFVRTNIPNVTVTAAGLDTIGASFEEAIFLKGEYLLKQGKISDYYFLAEGFVRAYTFDTDGNEITTFFYPHGRIAFEASSFFLRQPSSEYLQAISDCKVYVTNYEKLNTLFHSVPEFREFARAMLVREFVAYKKRTLAMINKSAEERYAGLLTENSEIFQYAQLKHIASYLGITDTSLSRIRKDYSKR